MLVDGRKIAGEIYREVANQVTHLDNQPHLTVFTCAPNFETQKYLALKMRKAREVGIGINVIEFPENITTEEVITSVANACMQTDGVIVQMPFPEHVAIDKVLSTIPPQYDVDVVNYTGLHDEVLPPVVGAIAEIAKRHEVMFSGQEVAIVGHGRLVGKPAEIWLKNLGAKTTVVTKESGDLEEAVASAKIVILGAGNPGFVTPEMISNESIIFDAGTSEEGGELRGDADPGCGAKATLLTPVPGGIGPITVAVLLRNVVYLASH